MKRFITLLGLLAALLMMSSCITHPNERAYTASAVRPEVDFPETFKVISFDFVSTESALTQARTQLDYFSTKIEWDRSSVERYSKWVQESKEQHYDPLVLETAENNLKEAQEDFAKDATMISHLEALVIDYNKNPGISLLSSAPEVAIYEMVYETADPDGNKHNGIAYSRFNTKGLLVGIKIDNRPWKHLGDFYTIPGYYDWL